jgi:hypothetical protein
MSNLCVYSFSISIDGFGAGPRQSRDNPLGVGGMALHQWAFATRTFCEMHGREGGTRLGTQVNGLIGVILC